ncbi:MAG TPA: cytochrome c biogenesis protein CcsA [Longimicrobiales bacterium]|nr:cytochrome c biogenesis protein CcsA [Longimicrobiales bacterium]
MIAAGHLAALAAYIVSALLLARSLAEGGRAVPWTASAALAAGVLLHAGALAWFSVRYGELPLAGIGPSLSTLGLVIGLFVLGAASLGEARPLGLAVVPVAAVLTGLALALGIAPSEPGGFFGSRGWFYLHVLLAFGGYAGLALASGAGLLYLLQLRELKDKRFGRVFRFLPSLDKLEDVGRRSLVVGLISLTLGLVLAWAWTVHFQGSLQLREPKVAWAVGTWVVMAAALGLRGGGPRRERWGAALSVGGFVLVVVVYLVLRVGMIHGGFF